MKVDSAFLRSKVARRIFFLFVACALLPIFALAVVSFLSVATKLQGQSEERLEAEGKDRAMAIYERLTFVASQLEMVAEQIAASSDGAPLSDVQPVGGTLRERFDGLALVRPTGPSLDLFGAVRESAEPSAEEREHLIADLPLLRFQLEPRTRLLLGRAVRPEDLGQGVLWGEINPPYLWWGPGGDNTLLPSQEMWIVDEASHLLFATTPEITALPRHVATQLAGSDRDHFEWSLDGIEYLAGYWTLHLRATFFAPGLRVVQSESKAILLRPLRDFRNVFPFVVLMSLCVVLLLSIAQIRRSLIPLEQLQEGTHRIATRQFGIPVQVKSGDEFEELADSFNTMAQRLDRQFSTLTTINEIVQAVLSALDRQRIVNAILSHLGDILPSDFLSVTLLRPGSPATGRTYFRRSESASETISQAVELTQEEEAQLRENPEYLSMEVADRLPSYLAPFADTELRSLVAFAILVQGKVSGLIALGFMESRTHDRQDLDQVRGLADQVAVALSNVLLIEELDQLNWRTLLALARAIDAKSPWTMGHSERVTQLAVRLGRAMGLPAKELEILHRGGLLHDIGKIGTPAHILDKPGKLTPEERDVMQDHTCMGARILEPIPGFAEVIPIVLQHHEWYNGEGYPSSLAGEEISLNARIFAVADCYDALRTARPYRPARDHEWVMDYLRKGSGSQFDPQVVEAFEKMMEKEAEERHLAASPPVE